MKKDWVLLEDCTGSFYELKLVIKADMPISFVDVEIMAGCTGYALREVLAGESLSEPLSAKYDYIKDVTTVRFRYDSTKSQRDDPDYILALGKIRQYISEGTPVRTTNRQGPETAGTRLVRGTEGIARVEVFVR